MSDGHQDPSPESLAARARTAMKRHSCSRPIAAALSDGLIHAETTVFDYGCGHGTDLRFLEKQGIPASGWDPHFQPFAPQTAAHVVNIGYVLNVIESPTERAATLKRAWSLAEKLLIVAVRIDRSLNDAEEFGDGLLTARGTFQKLFTQSELREYIEKVLGQRAQVVTLGVVYVFKDQEWEARYIATRALARRLEYRTELVESFARSQLARRLVALSNQLGRLPNAQEFQSWEKLIERFGSVQRIQRLVLRQIDPTAWEGPRSERREDVLTFLATLRLSNVPYPKLTALPMSIQTDLKSHFRNYAEAQEESIGFLYSLGTPGAVKAACKTSKVGKLLPEDLYVHRSAEDELPGLLRLMRHAGMQLIGEVKYDVLKLSLHGRSLSFLTYKDFDTDPHPALQTSVRVYLPKADYQIRDYSKSANPPILHRKETFVTPTYPYYGQFKLLSDQEEAAGLLGGNDIGFRERWQLLLAEKGFRIEEHALVVAASGPQAVGLVVADERANTTASAGGKLNDASDA